MKLKIGVRKPSAKRRIRARTTGRVKRGLKKSVNPLYGKKGMGLINDPEKAIYNKVYNKTSVSVDDIVLSSDHDKTGGKKQMSNTTNSKKAGMGCLSVILIIIFIFVSCTALSGKDEHNSRTITEVTTETSSESTTESKPDPMDRMTQIINKAETDSGSAENKDYSTAASYINKHINDFQKNDKTMEYMVYYGMLLYYGYGSGSKTSDMGYNAAEAARLVYAQKYDYSSDKVQSCINKVKADLNDMYNPTTEAATETTSQEFPTEHYDVETNPDTTFIINTNSMKFHLINGPDTDSITPEHRQETTLSREELINQGYEPCGRCFN